MDWWPNLKCPVQILPIYICVLKVLLTALVCTQTMYTGTWLAHLVTAFSCIFLKLVLKYCGLCWKDRNRNNNSVAHTTPQHNTQQCSAREKMFSTPRRPRKKPYYIYHFMTIDNKQTCLNFSKIFSGGQKKFRSPRTEGTFWSCSQWSQFWWSIWCPMW